MQQTDLWQAVLGEIELSISRGNFMTWFKNTQLVSQDSDSVIVGVPNIFIKQQLERKYTELISETLQKNGINPEKIIYKITSSAPKQIEEDTVLVSQAPADSIKTTVTSAPPNRLAQAYRQGINERYTFDNFV